MTKAQRLVPLILAAAVAVGAVLVLSSGGDDDPPQQATQPNAQAKPSDGADKPKRPREERLRVASGKPVGGIAELSFRKGDKVRFAVRSADTTDEVHVHGYDISKPLAPGRVARFRFTADIEGIFEIELENAGQRIAGLEVRP